MKACRNSRLPAPVRPRGFTLFEFMLAIAVAAMVLGLGVPMFQDFVRASRITGVANEFLSAVYLARSEAIKRRAPTVLCLSSDPNAATPACDGDGSQGWVVFVDDSDPEAVSVGEGDGNVDAAEEIVLRRGGVHPEVTVSTLPAGNESYMRFLATGMMREIGAVGTQMNTLMLCDERGNVVVSGDDDSAARAVIISPIGRPRVTRSADEIEDDLGGCP